jgi:hypothetical protein
MSTEPPASRRPFANVLDNSDDKVPVTRLTSSSNYVQGGMELTEAEKEEKEKFLMFTRVLMM